MVPDMSVLFHLLPSALHVFRVFFIFPIPPFQFFLVTLFMFRIINRTPEDIELAFILLKSLDLFCHSHCYINPCENTKLYHLLLICPQFLQCSTHTFEVRKISSPGMPDFIIAEPPSSSPYLYCPHNIVRHICFFQIVHFLQCQFHFKTACRIIKIFYFCRTDNRRCSPFGKLPCKGNL